VRFSASGITCQELSLQGTGQNEVYPIPIKVRCPKERASKIRNLGEIRKGFTKEFKKEVKKETRLGSRKNPGI